MNRREFLSSAALLAGRLALGGTADTPWSSLKPIRIRSTRSNFERNPLVRPFGFKGGYMTEIWQVVVQLESESGARATGLGTQGVLWSDAAVFESSAEAAGNAIMYAMTEYALRRARGREFRRPEELLDQLYPEVLEYGRRITGRPNLRPTFVLNALVPVDHAAWLLFAKEHGLRSFDDFIAPEYRSALAARQERLAAIPLIAYATPIEEIRAAVDQGYFFMKIKIGQPGSQADMLEKDKARITAIHQAIGGVRTPHTHDGRLPYYFDANGRYESKDTFLRLLDHLQKIGAFEQIVVMEEPFAEEAEVDVRDIPLRLAADETAHTDRHTIERIDMGYRAIAVKTIAKTLSMTMRIVSAAHARGVPCFCADLTVHPILVDWHKNFAARLPSFPGLRVGLLESNGHQNYRDWAAMVRHHPRGDASWTKVRNGMYELGPEFYAESGGIFEPSPHFERLIASPAELPA